MIKGSIENYIFRCKLNFFPQHFLGLAGPELESNPESLAFQGSMHNHFFKLRNSLDFDTYHLCIYLGITGIPALCLAAISSLSRAPEMKMVANYYI